MGFDLWQWGIPTIWKIASLTVAIFAAAITGYITFQLFHSLPHRLRQVVERIGLALIPERLQRTFENLRRVISIRTLTLLLLVICYAALALALFRTSVHKWYYGTALEKAQVQVQREERRDALRRYTEVLQFIESHPSPSYDCILAGAKIGRGNCHRLLGPVDSVLIELNDALTVARAAKCISTEGDAYFGFGAFYARKDPSLALSYLSQADSIVMHLLDNKRHAKVLRLKGQVLSNTKEIGTALILVDSAIEIFKLPFDSLETAISFVTRGDIFRKQAKYAEARECFRRAAELYKGVGVKIGLGNLYIFWAELEWTEGNLGILDSLYSEALERFKEGSDTLGMANAMFGTGRLDRANGEFELAKGYLHVASGWFDVAENAIGQVNALIELGQVYLRISQFDSAQVVFSKALSLVTSLRNPLSKAHAYLGLGEVAFERRDFGQGAQYYVMARTYYDTAHYAPGLTIALYFLGDLYRVAGDLNRASAYYDSSMSLCRDARCIADALWGKAQVRLAQKRYLDCHRLLDSAAANYGMVYRGTWDSLGIANVYLSRGKVYLAQRQLDAARKVALESERLSSVSSNPLGRANALYLLGAIEEAAGNQDAARRHFQTAQALYSRMGLDTEARECESQIETLGR